MNVNRFYGVLLAGALLLAMGACATAPVAATTAPPPRDVTLATAQNPVPDFGGVDLLPREVLFGNPDISGVRLSPDGKYLSYVGPVNGVLNVWVAPADKPGEAVAVTSDTGRGIRYHGWTYQPGVLVYVQDKDGDENWRLYGVNVATKKVQEYTAMDKVQARVEAVSPKKPNEILISINDRDPQYHDVYRLNLVTGKRKLVQKNEGYGGFMFDDTYALRFATKFTPDGGYEILKKTKKGFVPWRTIAMEDTMTTQPDGLSSDGKTMYFQTSQGRNTSALMAIDLATNKETLLAADDRADIDRVFHDPMTYKPLAVSVQYERSHWMFLDPQVEADFAELAKVRDGDFWPTSATRDNKTWIVAYLTDNGPVYFYRYDRATKTATFLFVHRKDLENLPLSHMYPVVIPSRDGKNLVSYYSLPVWADTNGSANQPLPMVLYVHGGPWARDSWGYDPVHQWLTNRGYAVLSVNYRGSTGFGKDFINAANREWAGTMHNDLIDGVNWAIDRGIAVKDKPAIMGGSYGGFATLVGMTFTPDVFACGVDIVGPSNLVTFMQTIPAYWQPMIDMLTTRIGDFRTEEGKAFLMSRSPISRVDAIVKPLLIGQGANDPRVAQAESDQIVNAMKAKNIPVTYVLYSDEGHGFARPENRESFFAVSEAFLSPILGGRYEPFGPIMQESSIQVPDGVQYVPGLAEALKKK